MSPFNEGIEVNDEQQRRDDDDGSVIDLEKGHDDHKQFSRRSSTDSTTSSFSESVVPEQHPERNPNETDKTQETKKNPSSSCPFNKEYSSREYCFVICAGLALSFNSGYINGACLSGLMTQQRQSVSGFTGAYTASALSLADGNTDFFGFQVCMILSFMAGSTLTGFLSPRAVPWRIQPTYGPTFMIGGLFLIASTMIAIFDSNERRLFYFAAAANGVQNGISSMYSSNLIRTCHLTGTSTDIGLLVGQYLRGNRHQVWKLRILVGLALSFWLGGIVSYYVTFQLTNESLLFNAVLFLCIGISLIVFLVKSLGISVWQACFGTWSWDEALTKLNVRTRDGKPVSEQDMMTVFDNIDMDGNGLIEESELLQALRSAGFLGISKKQVRSLLKVADGNGDGLISRDEWKELVQGQNVATTTTKL